MGRADELAAIDDLLESAARRRGRALALEGEAGVGKSRLAAEAVARAADRGFTVAVGRATATAPVPYRALTEALLSAARLRGVPHGPAVDPYRAALGRLVPAWAGGTEPADASLVALGEAALQAFSALAGPSAAVVVLEDLHWADGETLGVLEYVADNLSGAPIAVVATMRSAPEAAVRLVRGLASRGSASHLVVAPLAGGEVAELAAACLGTDPDGLPPELAALVAQKADGLPLIVEDLVSAFASDVRPGAQAPRFADLVRARLGQLDPESRTIVAAASVLGPAFDWRFLPAITGLPEATVAAVLEQAAGLNLMKTADGRFEFRHALTRDVVVADLSPPEREALCRTAGKAVAEAGPADDARTALLADLYLGAGDMDEAQTLLLSVARAAVGRGALATADATLRRALASDPQGPSALDARMLLVRVLLEAGQPLTALEMGPALVDDLTRAGRPLELPAARVLLARAAVAAGRIDDARRQLEDARRGADGRQLAEIAVVEAQTALAAIEADRLLAAEHLGLRAVGAAEAAGAPDLVCDALEVVGRCARVRSLDDAAAVFTRQLATAEAQGLVLWRIRALNELGTVDMFRDADGTRLHQARQAAADAGALALAGGIDVNIVALHIMRGEYDEAGAAVKRCSALARRCRLDQLQGVAELFMGVLATHQGRYADMQRHVRAAEALAGDDPDVLVGTRGMCLAMAAILREDHRRAGLHFAEAAGRLVGRPPLAINPIEGPWLLLRASQGDAGEVDVGRYAASQAKGSRWSTLWGELARAVVLGRAGDVGPAGSAAREAVRAGRPLPLFLAVGHRLAGEAALNDGWGEPDRWLASAAQTFGDHGHSRAAAACRDLLRQSGERVPRPRAADRIVPAPLRRMGVTAREYEVLGLVAERLGNREIAARLYLSPRTVEKHVASLLTKTGCAGRDPLGELARQQIEA